MGVELVYEALILGQGRTPNGSGQKGRRIEVLHGQLSGTDKEALKRRTRDVGWSTAFHWCRYLDDTVKHAQRKYLMYDTQRQRQGTSFPTHGPPASPVWCGCSRKRSNRSPSASTSSAAFRTRETIARGTGIRELSRLRRVYGPGNWRKRKGTARIRLENGAVRLAELHWYEAHGIGRREFKRKRNLNQQ